MKVLSVASSYSVQPEQNVITVSRIKDAGCPSRNVAKDCLLLLGLGAVMVKNSRL